MRKNGETLGNKQCFLVCTGAVLTAVQYGGVREIQNAR